MLRVRGRVVRVRRGRHVLGLERERHDVVGRPIYAAQKGGDPKSAGDVRQ